MQRDAYDSAYQKYKIKFTIRSLSLAGHKFVLPQSRIVYPSSMTYFAQRGLLRVGFRTKDRKRYSGINHDVSLQIRKKEALFRVLVKIPLTVRILCPECFGSNIYCESCGGQGTYKGTRNLEVLFEPELMVNDRVYEFELSRFRPDKFIHFKKKILRVKIEILP